MRPFTLLLALNPEAWRNRKSHFTRAMLESEMEHDRRARHRHRRRRIRARIRFDLRRGI